MAAATSSVGRFWGNFAAARAGNPAPAAPAPPAIHPPIRQPGVRTRSALRGALGEVAIGPLQEGGLDGWKWLPHLCSAMHGALAGESLKAFLFLRLQTTLVEADGSVEEYEFLWSGKLHRFDSRADIPIRLAAWYAELQNCLEDPNKTHYQFVVTGIREAVLTWVVNRARRAGSFVPSPKWLRNGGSIVNVQTKDRHDCFKVSCICAVHSVRGNAANPYTYDKLIKDGKCLLNFEGVQAPAGEEDIKLFEKLNTPWKVVIYGVGKDDDEDGLQHIHPLRMPVEKNAVVASNVIPLLQLEDEGGSLHYACIRPERLDSLLKRPKEGLRFDNTGHEVQYPCRFCMHVYSHKRLLDKHLEGGCETCCEALLEMPKPGPDGAPPTCKHSPANPRNGDKSQRSPWIISADFECGHEACTTNPTGPLRPKTLLVAEQEPTGWAMHVLSTLPDQPPRHYRYNGPNAVSAFWAKLREVEEIIRARMAADHPLCMTPEDEQAFQSSEQCFFCKQPFSSSSCAKSKGERKKEQADLRATIALAVKNKKAASVIHNLQTQLHEVNSRKVRHHCHLTGPFMGAAHSSCNLAHSFGKFVVDKSGNRKFEMRYKVPVFFHNLKGYDSHFLVRAMHEFDEEPQVIAQNSEKFIAFTARSFQFKDSLAFLNANLDELAQKLPDSEMKQLLHNPSIPAGMCPKRALELLRRKGIFPYEYIDSLERLKERCVPPIEAFYSTLTGKGITAEEYEHVQLVWREFACETLADYQDLYCSTDVLLLADVFEAYRTQTLQHFDLDPAHFLTLPNCQWEGLLRGAYQGNIPIQLELMTDRSMYEMCEKGLLGGLCSVGRQKVTHANNSHCPNHDPKKPTTSILYVDAVNLYGWAMCQPLPYANFEWAGEMSISELATIARSYRDDDSVGYIVEVDAECPDEHHEMQTSLPGFPEKRISHRAG